MDIFKVIENTRQLKQYNPKVHDPLMTFLMATYPEGLIIDENINKKEHLNDLPRNCEDGLGIYDVGDVIYEWMSDDVKYIGILSKFDTELLWLALKYEGDGSVVVHIITNASGAKVIDSIPISVICHSENGIGHPIRKRQWNLATVIIEQITHTSNVQELLS